VQKEVETCYDNIMAKGVYDKDAYIAKNKDEYWAESTQAWFEATVRTDVTCGIRTKHELAERDPELAKLMLRIYGANTWIYPDTAPNKFRGKPPACTRVPPAQIAQRLGVPAPPVRSGRRVPVVVHVARGTIGKTIGRVPGVQPVARGGVHIGKKIAGKIWNFIKD
jgi:hypothetical protein